MRLQENPLVQDDDDDDDTACRDGEDPPHRPAPSLQCCANLLDRPCRETPNAPCAVLVMPSLQNNDATTMTAAAYSNNNNNRTISVPLSYRQARAALLEHQMWLQQQIRLLCLEEEVLSQSKDEEVAVAYLSHNSIDLFLSVLACTSLPETSAATRSSNENHDILTVVPVLLNTRWTVQEMILALQLFDHDTEEKDDDDDDAQKTSLTLVLYGPGMEQSAIQLAEATVTAATAAASSSCDSTRKTTRTVIHCQPIPTFALSYLLPGQREIMQSFDPRKLSATKADHDASSRYSKQNETARHQQQPQSASTITLRASNNKSFSRQDAIIVFTSGTSSRHGAKGVRLSHEAICMQMAAKCRDGGGDGGDGGGYSSQTALLASTLPFFHIGGLCNLWAVWMAGGLLIVPYNDTKVNSNKTVGSFDPAQVFSLVQGLYVESLSSLCTVNTLVVVPAMIFAMKKYHQSAEVKSQQYPQVELIVVGGQSLSDQQRVFCQTVFPNATLVQTYACTEAASSLTFYTVPKELEGSTKRRTKANQGILSGDCVGKSPPHVQLCLLDKDLWNEKAMIRDIQRPFTPGVIATCGPHIMNGYWKRGLRRRQDGGQKEDKNWFVTNDLGFWDFEGDLYFSGRVYDAIRTGGETVMASEVERVILLHPDVEECAIFALPDPQFGETVACAIVCRSNNSCPSLELLRVWCQKQGLAGFKQPRRLFRVSNLPKNSSGKILKFLLVERFHKMTDLCSKL